VDIAATETLILGVSTPENWWQLGAHPKSGAETLTFYSVVYSSQSACSQTRQRSNTHSHATKAVKEYKFALTVLLAGQLYLKPGARLVRC